MNLDELQSIQSRERQATSLQELRPTFYQDVGEFIRELVRERDRTAERADDPFASPDVRRLTDDIETAKATVEALYERRVGKVVKSASIAAAGMPADDDGLTEEEQQLFETLVARIEQNRGRVLDGVIDDAGSDISCARSSKPQSSTEPSADATDPAASGNPGQIPHSTPGADSAPDVGSDSDLDAETTAHPEPGAAADLGIDPTPDSGPVRDDEAVGVAEVMGADTDGDVTGGDAAASSDSVTADDDRHTPGAAESGDVAATGRSVDAVDRTTVRITRDVGEVFGVDERAYDLSSDDVVTLPAENAAPLVERDAAERLR